MSAPTSAESTTVNLGPVEEIPLGEGRAFAVGSDQIAVSGSGAGSIRAVSAVCPHRGGPIADGQIDGRIVLCPLHLNAFELDSGCSTTGQEPLRSYPVVIDEDLNILLGPSTTPLHLT